MSTYNNLLSPMAYTHCPPVTTNNPRCPPVKTNYPPCPPVTTNYPRWPL